MPMLNKKFFQKIRENLITYAAERREVIKQAGDAGHHAKRAIFALQRGDNKAAAVSLIEAQKKLSAVYKQYRKDPRLFDEGSYRAALEEFVEATLFRQFLQNEEFTEIKGLPIDSAVYIAGLCDVPGELLRYAVKSATTRDFAMVKKCFAVAEEILAILIDMDLTGYQRQKFDQAKQALQKLEQVVYEVSLKTELR